MGFLSKLFSHKSVEEVADEIANTYAEEVQADNAEQTENEPVNMLEVTDTGEIEYTEKTETEQGEPTPQEDMQTDDPSEVRRHIITFRVNDAELAAAGVPANLVRFSCGLENAQDLIEDIAQALEKI